jgi:MinD-like ATPase involved in chromosome partitioning or flagellar assembly
MRVVVAVDEPRAGAIAEGLRREGIDVVGTIPAPALQDAAVASSRRDPARRTVGAPDAELIAAADVIVLHATRRTLTAEAVALCDGFGARIVPLCDTDAEARLAELFGLGTAMRLDSEPWQVADALGSAPASAASRAPSARPAPVIAVWGPAGAPGRSTVAIELAVELARGGRRVGLVDADTHAPSIALSLGLADEGPGFAAACRQAELGGLDARELTRISTPLLPSGVEILTGINRPSRWPEVSDPRVTAALAVCREWVDHTVVDTSSSLERDEEIVSDLEGPRRNAATLAALRSADLVVAVAGADPIGVARFIRGYAELRATVGTTRVAVVANRLRAGALGIDGRGQIRRALERFAGIDDVWFVPMDPRSADAALLAARPIAAVAPRSPFTLALRRFVGEAVAPMVEARQTLRRGARRRIRPVHDAVEPVLGADAGRAGGRLRP